MADYVKIPVDLTRGIYDFIGTTASPATDLPFAAPGSTYRKVSGGTGDMLWQRTASAWEAIASIASGITQAFADGRYAQLAAANTMTNGVPFSFTNGTSNMLLWNGAGVNPPTITTARSTGSKLVLFQAFSNGATADYAIGIEGSTLWHGVPTTGEVFKWYGGATLAAKLTGGGVLTLNPANAGQSNAFLVARVAGNSFEFGHNNTAGYGSTIGAETSSGIPFIAFNAELTPGVNLYTTRGVKGSVFRSDLNGGFGWFTVSNTNAANQSLTGLMSLSAAGALSTGSITMNGGSVINGGSTFSLTLSGSPTSVQQIRMGDSSVFGVIGTEFSSGTACWTYNAYQNTYNTDSWTQSFASLRSIIAEVGVNGFALFAAVAGKATAARATFWGTAVAYISPSGGIGGSGQLRMGNQAGANGLDGDIIAARSTTTGVIYFGNSTSQYLYHDGSNYSFGPVGAVYGPDFVLQ